MKRKKNMKRKRNSAQVGSKNSPRAPGAQIKVENELVTNEIMLTRIKGETSNAVAGNSLKSEADYCDGLVTTSTSDSQVNVQFPSHDLTDSKQFDFSQTKVVVKVEREEGNNIFLGESVGCSAEDSVLKIAADEVMRKESVGNLVRNVSVCFNSPAAEQFNCLQTTLSIKTEVVEEEIVHNELVCSTFAEGVLKIADNDEGIAAECVNFVPDVWKNGTKVEELKAEEGLITSESVRVADGTLKIADNDKDIAAEHLNLLSDEWKNGTKLEELKVEEGLITNELVGPLPKDLKDGKGASTITFPKILKIILTRCDAMTKSNTNPASKIGNKDLPNFPTAGIKVENQFAENEIKLMQKAVKSEESAITENKPLEFHCLPVIQGVSALEEVTKKNCVEVTQAGHSKALQLSCSSERHFKHSHHGGRFKRKYIMTNRKRRLDSETVYSCAYCHYKCKGKAAFVSHMITHSSERPHSCPHCLKAFKRRGSLRKHLELYCPSWRGLSAHLESVNAEEKRFGCAHCPARYSKRDRLIRHLSVHSNERNYACSRCPAKFRSYAILYGHLKSHSEERYGCAHCSGQFKGRNSIKRHLNIAHLGMKKSFVCEQCPASFYRKDSLKEHLLVHSKEKAFACDQCPAKFGTTSKLKRHASVHSTERPFECAKCPKSFKSHRTLQRHARIHSGVNLYACDQCPAKFTAPFILKNHLETHSGQGVTCKICSKTLKTRKVLELHLKLRHASNRPYSCPECQLTFLSSIQLQRHSTMHTDERRFGCAHCTAKFVQRHILLVHLKSHAEKKPFVCPQCSGGFTQKGSLKLHLKLKRCRAESSLVPYQSSDS